MQCYGKSKVKFPYFKSLIKAMLKAMLKVILKAVLMVMALVIQLEDHQVRMNHLLAVKMTKVKIG